MKHTVLVLFISSFIFTSFTFEEKYLIDIRLLPNNNYRISNKTEAVSKVDFQADEKTLSQLREKGVQFPVDMFITQHIIQRIQTGEVKIDSTFDVQMIVEEYSKDQTVNGISIALPENQNLRDFKIYGNYTSNNKLENITIVSDIMSEELKSTLSKMLENMLQYINYPNYPLSIGDSFKQEVPLQFPVGGAVVINIKIMVTYTLEKVSEDKAYFDTDSYIVITKEDNNYTINAGGGGKGKLIHDMKLSYPIEYTSDLAMNLEVNFANL